ncbi:MAG TPA: DUF4286 family protein [Phycisphaerales bacterium]|nr:DUF4286 family protein [Phycisphaerales bacterium]
MTNGRVAYTVRAECADAQVAEEWIAWLRNGHLAEVLNGGALCADVVRLDGEKIVCEVRYVFASSESFAQYEKEFAPKLRAEGVRKFPPERGIIYARSVGNVEAQMAR